MQKSKDSLKACFEYVNISLYHVTGKTLFVFGKFKQLEICLFFSTLKWVYDDNAHSVAQLCTLLISQPEVFCFIFAHTN